MNEFYVPENKTKLKRKMWPARQGKIKKCDEISGNICVTGFLYLFNLFLRPRLLFADKFISFHFIINLLRMNE